MSLLALVMFLVALGLVVLHFPVTPLTARVIRVVLVVLMVIWFLFLLGIMPGSGTVHFGR